MFTGKGLYEKLHIVKCESCLFHSPTCRLQGGGHGRLDRDVLIVLLSLYLPSSHKCRYFIVLVFGDHFTILSNSHQLICLTLSGHDVCSRWPSDFTPSSWLFPTDHMHSQHSYLRTPLGPAYAIGTNTQKFQKIKEPCRTTSKYCLINYAYFTKTITELSGGAPPPTGISLFS